MYQHAVYLCSQKVPNTLVASNYMFQHVHGRFSIARFRLNISRSLLPSLWQTYHEINWWNPQIYVCKKVYRFCEFMLQVPFSECFPAFSDILRLLPDSWGSELWEPFFQAGWISNIGALQWWGSSLSHTYTHTLSLSLSISLFHSITLFFPLSISLSFCLSLYISFFLSFFLSLSLSLSPSFSLFLSLFFFSLSLSLSLSLPPLCSILRLVEDVDILFALNDLISIWRLEGDCVVGTHIAPGWSAAQDWWHHTRPQDYNCNPGSLLGLLESSS